MPGQRLSERDWRALQRLADQYGDPRDIEADLAELDELRNRLGAIGGPRPFHNREPDWDPVLPGDGLAPQSVSEVLALYDRGLLDDEELERLLGRGGAAGGDPGRRWWRRRGQPAYLIHRLGWGATWRFAALAGLQLLELPERWLIGFAAALVVLLLAGLPLKLWRRRNLFGTVWRLALAEALCLATVRLPPIFYFSGLGLGAAILMADLIWTVLWPWMYEGSAES
ncbi:MAG: hypothetical protein ACREQM_15375 [Candidatus Dormibacteraceae bacterium]